MGINRFKNKLLQITIPKELHNSLNELVGLLRQRGVSITKSILITNAIMFYMEYVASLDEQAKEMEKEYKGGN